MIIRLYELGKDGRKFSFSKETEEIESALSEDLKGQSFNIDFYLRPLSTKTFEMKGTFSARVPQVCSKCSEDFFMTLDLNFHEILVQPQPEDRKGKYAKTHSAVEESLSSYEYLPDLTFDAGEYFRELLGISLPTYPKHSPEEIEVCLEALNDLGVKIDDPEEGVEFVDAAHSPFKALQNLKLN